MSTVCAATTINREKKARQHATPPNPRGPLEEPPTQLLRYCPSHTQQQAFRSWGFIRSRSDYPWSDYLCVVVPSDLSGSLEHQDQQAFPEKSAPPKFYFGRRACSGSVAALVGTTVDSRISAILHLPAVSPKKTSNVPKTKKTKWGRSRR